MRICRKCVMPSTRPGIWFDEDGVCFPCQVAEAQRAVDWEVRKTELRNIAEWGRQRRKCGYDCIVAVSGGKDSTRQALYARDELGLRPLLVSCTYPPEQQSIIGAHNLSNVIELGFDTIVVGPGPEKWKKLMKRAFYKFGNWAKATELALYAVPPRVAMAYGIPLIFLGENNVLTYGDVGGSMGGDANRVKYNNTLAGGSPEDLMGDGITECDVLWFTYPSDEEMQRANLRVVYLGFYIEDFNLHTNARIAMQHGLKIRDTRPEEVGALNQFEDLDEDFVHVNQMLKFFKFGFARVADEASQAVRLGLMSRGEAIEVSRKYDGRCAPRYIKRFCDYIGIDEAEFWRVADSYRNKDIWTKDANGGWCLQTPLAVSVGAGDGSEGA